MQNILSFDIEISNVFELKPGEELEKYAPFQISVAAAVGDWVSPRSLWYSVDGNGELGPSLNKTDAALMLDCLELALNQGIMLCAWNGLGFDMRWIGHNAEDLDRAAKLALRIYDPMFQFFNQTGYMVGLAAVAEGFGIQQKKLMHGSEAPKAWRDGHYKQVMDYVIGDCELTNEVVRRIQAEGGVRWITKKGLPKFEPIRRLKTVREVMADPAPDQSWQSNPIPKERFYAWALPYIAVGV
ncbi:MAG: hypothetical protein AMXMBFR84_37710 [Candidatus Hydrogenedentota bacterium]